MITQDNSIHTATVTQDHSIHTAMVTQDHSIHRNTGPHITATSLRFRAHSSYHLPRGRGCAQQLPPAAGQGLQTESQSGPQSYITKGDAALADSSIEEIPLLAAALVQVHLNDDLSAQTATHVQCCRGIIIVGPGSMRRPKSSQKTGVDQELQRVMGQGECLMRDNP